MTDQLPSLVPHLAVNGARDAIEFYKKALGAVEVMAIPAEDGKRLLHAHITINGGAVYLHDDFPDFCPSGANANIKSPTALGGTSLVVHLEVKNCDEAMKQAVDAGAKVVMPAMDAFWGARYGQVVDPFGHAWSFAHPLPPKAG
ncbi:VOC family protein [Bradyrhizobium sp. SYSU BS000235]|uniref:VOC family protein n=1 Tax=Bradyrhizobium sp. SYSU BS000235 TaxID=3411332 RepID=UPI003C7192A4